MAMITCKECGKEFSDRADKCPNCGAPIAYSREVGKTYELNEVPVKKGRFETWKLVSGILSIILFVLVSMQSCAVGMGNALFDSGEISGTAGIIVSIMLLCGGIVSVVTRKGGKGGNIAAFVLYLLGAFFGFSLAGSYTDLIIWSSWCCICALFAILALILGDKK